MSSLLLVFIPSRGKQKSDREKSLEILTLAGGIWGCASVPSVKGCNGTCKDSKYTLIGKGKKYIIMEMPLPAIWKILQKRNRLCGHVKGESPRHVFWLKALANWLQV